jgi:hypothetical protein
MIPPPPETGWNLVFRVFYAVAHGIMLLCVAGTIAVLFVCMWRSL